jgi:ribosomal protein L11 methyltransferase
VIPGAHDGESGARSSDHWLQVRVHPGENREAVLAALFSAGAASVQEVGEQLVTVLEDDTRADSVTCAVLAASPGARIDTEPTTPVDWSERWKQGLRAQELGPIVVAPPWLASRYDRASTVIIDPGMAFGTGEHPTTRGVVRLLSRVVRHGDRVADLGTGSAVLSIAAAKLGAGRVVAIEIDPDAIGNAQANVERNGVTERVTVLEGDARVLLPLVAPVRLVIANIISSVLLEMLPTIASSVSGDGEAILGGILRQERDELLAAIAAGGWHVTFEDHEDPWWSVAITRS